MLKIKIILKRKINKIITYEAMMFSFHLKTYFVLLLKLCFNCKTRKNFGINKSDSVRLFLAIKFFSKRYKISLKNSLDSNVSFLIVGYHLLGILYNLNSSFALLQSKSKSFVRKQIFLSFNYIPSSLSLSLSLQNRQL